LLIFTNWKKKNAPVKGEWYPVCILRIQKYGVPRGVFPIALHVYPTPTPDDICLTVSKKRKKKKKNAPPELPCSPSIRGVEEEVCLGVPFPSEIHGHRIQGAESVEVSEYAFPDRR
jgi:hypothetical protein